MYYGEFLRVRRALTCLAICLVVFDALFGALVLAAKLSGSYHAVPPNAVHIPLGTLFPFAAFIALFLATAFGTSLASENEGHLDLAWTKPVSRARYALTLFGVDIAGIVLAFLIGLVLAVIVPLTMVGLIGSISLDHSGLEFVRQLAFLIAWYALVQMITASLRSGAGMVAGLSAIPAVAVAILAKVPLPPAWHSAFTTLGFFDPVAYWTGVQVDNSGAHVESFLTLGLFLTIGALGILALAYGSIAVAQWRRLEA